MTCKCPKCHTRQLWKIRLCKWVAADFERLQPGHCTAARTADIQRAPNCIGFCAKGVDPT